MALSLVQKNGDDGCEGSHAVDCGCSGSSVDDDLGNHDDGGDGGNGGVWSDGSVGSK